MTFLLGVKGAKSASISHPLCLEASANLTKQRANELMAELIAGSKTAADTLIRGHMNLATKIVGKYAYVRGLDKQPDDLMSEAMLAMCKLLKRVKSGDVVCENITEYMIGAIHSHCANFVRDDRILGMCHSAKWKRKQRGLDSPDIRVYSIDAPQTTRVRSESGADSEQVSNVTPYQNSITVSSEVGLVELRELLSKSIESGFEEQVMVLKIEGYDVRSIAGKLSCSKSKVSISLNKVKRCLKEQLEV